jgi:hypothetical protein
LALIWFAPFMNLQNKKGSGPSRISQEEAADDATRDSPACARQATNGEENISVWRGGFTSAVANWNSESRDEFVGTLSEEVRSL